MFDVHELNIAIEMWGVVFCAIGIASALLLLRADARNRNLIVGIFASELVMAGGDALAGLFRGQEGSLAWAMTHAGNFATFAGGFLLLAFLTRYLCVRAEEAGSPSLRPWVVAVVIAAGAMCVLTLYGALYYIDEANVYHRTDWYWAGQVLVLVVSLANAVLIWRYRRGLGSSALVCLLFFALVPSLSSLAQIFVYGLNFNVVASVVGTIVVFLEMQRHSSQVLIHRTQELAAARVEASESRIAVMVSQIQPHFLFNTLDTIYGLVDEDAEKAKEAIASFSRYLRANLDSLNHNAPVPIEREMQHVRTYLELEQASDEERLEYEIDEQATGFNVPALSVQTIAENAVKHGIGKREKGGTVIVRTREQASEYTVAVIDDGVGFDAGDQSVWGVGLENTRSRLEAMCGGALDVASVPGEGTTVILHIPKKRGGSEQ